MRARDINIPGTNPVEVTNHPNVGETVTVDEQERYRITIPVLLIIFDDDRSHGTDQNPPFWTPEAQGNALRDDIDRIQRYYAENSYGTFDIQCVLRTVFLDQPHSWRGNATTTPDYSGENGVLANPQDFPPAQDYTGYGGFIVYERDPAVDTTPWHRNYNAIAERNYCQAALLAANEQGAQPWDHGLSFDDWLDAGTPSGDTHARVVFVSRGITGGGGDRRYGTYNSGDSMSDYDLTPLPLSLFGRNFHEYVWYAFYDNGDVRAETLAHELGHTIGVGDYYNIQVSSVERLSLMGYTDGEFPHFDAYTKFRWNWLDPEVIEPTPHRRRITLAPVTANASNALLLRPDPIGHPDEFFLLEVRRHDAQRWDGAQLEFDQRLPASLQGLHIYRCNTVGSTPQQPSVVIEDSASGGASDAFFPGHSFTAPAADFYDGSTTRLTVKVVDASTSGATLDLSWDVSAGVAQFYRVFSTGQIGLVRKHTGWRETWSAIVAGNFGSGAPRDLLMYDATAGEAEIHRCDGAGRLTLLRRHSNWRKTWDVIATGEFGGGGRTDLLLYDRLAGVGEFYAVGSTGAISLLRQHTGWRKTWTTIVAGRLGSGASPGLLFYDAKSGEAEIYSVSQGQLNFVKKHTGWRRTWTNIVVAQMAGSSYADFLMYDRNAGEVEVHRGGPGGAMTRLKAHTGWRRTWTYLIPGHFDMPSGNSHADLVLYDRTVGDGCVLRSDGHGDFTTLHDHNNWRKTWDAIVPVQSSGNSHTDLLFYDASRAGEGEFHSTDGHGRTSLLDRHPGWRKMWSRIIAGNFSGSHHSDLLFYDPTEGVGEFYTTDGPGKIHLLRQHDNWRRTWRSIVPGNFGGGNTTDLLFYDPSSRCAEFYSTDSQGGISLLKQHENWRSTWFIIVPGSYGAGGRTDLLLYDPTRGHGEFYTSDGQGGINLLRRHENWRQTWALIVPGQFGAGGNTDLLFYDPTEGVGEFCSTDGQGKIHLLRRHDNWRRTWRMILPGNFGGGDTTDLLFYDPSSRCAEFYTTDGQGGISLIRKYDNWRPTWAEIVPGVFDSSGFTGLLLYDRSSE